MMIILSSLKLGLTRETKCSFDKGHRLAPTMSPALGSVHGGEGRGQLHTPLDQGGSKSQGEESAQV